MCTVRVYSSIPSAVAVARSPRGFSAFYCHHPIQLCMDFKRTDTPSTSSTCESRINVINEHEQVVGVEISATLVQLRAKPARAGPEASSRGVVAHAHKNPEMARGRGCRSPRKVFACKLLATSRGRLGGGSPKVSRWAGVASHKVRVATPDPSEPPSWQRTKDTTQFGVQHWCPGTSINIFETPSPIRTDTVVLNTKDYRNRSSPPTNRIKGRNLIHGL